MKKFFIRIIVKIVYLWGILWYDKKYLTGKYFDKEHFSKGWIWILKYWFGQKVIGYGKDIPWPVPKGVMFSNPKNIIFSPDDMYELQNNGCYFQAINAKLIIGRGTKIAPNCGFITTNHDFYDLNKSAEGKEVNIGENCWIGMNSIILPGVILGNHTIVGAGSVVTKSFPEGNCVIAGNPAKFVKKI